MKLTQERAKELFDYQDGNLIWKISPAKNVKAGVVAGTLTNHGYLFTQVEGNRRYLNHRLVWLLHKGYFPENGLDHIDRNKLNNRIENLREVSQSCNVRNSSLRIDCKSGIRGVCWDTNRGKWMSGISINSKFITIGRMSDFTEAVAHRLAAEQALDWDGCDSSSSAFIFMKEYARNKI